VSPILKSFLFGIFYFSQVSRPLFAAIPTNCGLPGLLDHGGKIFTLETDRSAHADSGNAPLKNPQSHRMRGNFQKISRFFNLKKIRHCSSLPSF
jgi:hypothetical protein